MRRTVMINGQLVQVGKTLVQTKAVPRVRLEKPCCGGNKVDRQVKAFREKQRRLRMERL